MIYLRSLKIYNQSTWTGIFPACIHLLLYSVRTFSSKHTEMCHINTIVDQLNSKTMHFYNLLFALDTLRKGQRKDAFFSDIIRYLEDNNLPSNIKCQPSIIAEAENYLLFNTLLFNFTIKSTKTVEHKLTLCIPLELSDGIFELYNSGLRELIIKSDRNSSLETCTMQLVKPDHT